ncbi:hypothetical protein KNU10_gp88 [Gordonia phage Foxboro]|uniref:Uncharacterized protein n=1 Tax=Gordonia phage Foxboro TaxID=2301602 RepID=A0A385UHB6_9CAUD|nr:hypothetical protein KNU10_gp88 [Gordonia phage Foxboro]AYB69229.1 hypothetical protein SEA_FOXBORO_88 [Gordonia phage Foxboro]
MHTNQVTSADGVTVTRYLTLDDVVEYSRTDRYPAPRSATGYGESATAHTLRCAVGDDGRILTRRVYVLNYGNGGGTPYVYGRVSGERVMFYLDPWCEDYIRAMVALGRKTSAVETLDVTRAATQDRWNNYGYADRVRVDGSPRGPLRVHATSKPDDVGRVTREGRLYFARREGAL